MNTSTHGPVTTDHAPPAEAESAASDSAATGPANPSRRRLMRTAGVAGTAAVIGSSAAVTSACSSDEGGAQGQESTPAQEATVAVADVPVGSGTVIDESYVVTQPQEGEFFAFTSVCTHQGCQVREVTSEAIICPCHASQFSVSTGEVISGPAEEPLQSYEVSESDGTLTVKGG
ncbi:Rieske (2Fe-2S) protein [Brevibacterium sp. 'Marine']|uniref:Rieske (2Fe-2S) protein n=1 Tax=Brevibacterium sp. 'Marine' TaxID=2725563 RepID=UPI00145D078B|nr:Rieske (2Fe-2S) protein [Brevibacterium sp. 'Marine']